MELDLKEDILMAYAAGMIDGDGSICFQKKGKYLTPCVKVALSFHDLTIFFMKNFGGKLGRSRNLFSWSLRKNKETIEFLKKIQDFLIEKRDLCMAVLTNDYQKTKELNHFTCQSNVIPISRFLNDNQVWAYIAGFIDSDGHITIKKRLRSSEKKKRTCADYSLEVGLGGTDFRATYFISDFIKKGTLKIRPHKFCQNGKRSDFRITSLQDVKYVLENLLPYLFIKKRHAEIILDYIKGYKTIHGPIDKKIVNDQVNHREICYQRIKELQIRK